MAEPPAFLAADTRRRQAFDFAAAAYDGKLRRGQHDLEHPLLTAALLDRARADDDLVVAGLLHDVLEDTDADPQELRARFGDRIADVVIAVSEDPDIDDYHDRKAALREKIVQAGPDAAIVALADKVATVDDLRETGEPLSPEREHHFRETLRLLQERCGDLPFATELRAGLDELTRSAG